MKIVSLNNTVDEQFDAVANSVSQIEEEAIETAAIAMPDEAVEEAAESTVLEESVDELTDVAAAGDATDEANERDIVNEPEVIVRKRKKHKHRRKKKTAWKVLIVVIVLAVALVAGAFAFYKHGEISVLAQTNITEAVSQQTIEYAGSKYAFNENMKTILLIGHDDEADTSQGRRPNEADMVAAVAVDVATGKITIIGISRDTMCLVDQYSEDEFVGTIREQLCMAYGYRSTPEAGSENVVKSAQTILCNIPIKYYYTMDEAAIAELNDAIGGVELVPLQSIPRTEIVEGKKTVLLGKEAHDYVQWRDVHNLNSSKDRQARELQYLQAFIKQAFGDTTGIAKKVTNLAGIVSEYSVTNISPSEMFYLGNVLAGSDRDDVEIIMLDGTTRQNGTYVEYTLDENALYKTVLDTYYTKVE